MPRSGDRLMPACVRFLVQNLVDCQRHYDAVFFTEETVDLARGVAAVVEADKTFARRAVKELRMSAASRDLVCTSERIRRAWEGVKVPSFSM